MTTDSLFQTKNKKGMKAMFYCINCSDIHHEKHPNDKVFKNGFYIDPFLGDRYPVVCVKMPKIMKQGSLF